MLASSTGMASSISCSVGLHGGRPPRPRAGSPVSDATVRWNRESAWRCSAGLRAAGHVGVRLLERRAGLRRRGRARGRERGGAGLDDAAEVQRVQPVLAARRGDPRRGPRRRRAGLERHDGAAAAAARGLDQPGLPQGGHRLAQGRPGDLQPLGELALGRQRAAARVDARAGSPWRAAPRRPRTRGARAPAAAPPRGGGASGEAVMGSSSGPVGRGVNAQWSEFRPILRQELFTARLGAGLASDHIRTIHLRRCPMPEAHEPIRLTSHEIHNEDEKHLAKLGYKQDLNRSLVGILELRDLVLDHLDPGRLLHQLRRRLQQRRPDLDLVVVADPRSVHPDHRVHDVRAGLGVPDLGWHLLVGVQARRPGGGLLHRLAEPDRPRSR